MYLRNTCDFNKAKAVLTQKGRACLQEAATFTAVKALGYCPVDTGHLRSTITVIHSNTGDMNAISVVYVGASYAVPVEFGHVTRSGNWVPGHFFLSRALADAAEAWPGIVKQTWAGGAGADGSPQLGTEFS